MDNEKKTKAKLYVLNDYLRFERKIYQVFGFSLGRPIKMKTILYFIIAVVIEVLIYHTPIIGGVLKSLPEVFLVIIPATFAYLLSDIRTEGRTPIAFFRSLFLYYLRKAKWVTYRRGREIKKLTNYRFEGYSSITFAEDRSDDESYKPRKVKFKKKRKEKGLFSIPKFY